jgi:ribonuclease J
LAQEIGYDSRNVLIPEDGEILEFSSDGRVKVVQKIDLENVMVDGLGVGDVGNIVLRDRQTIATEGIVVVVLPIEQTSGRITAEPDIISRGFVYMKESGDLVDRAKHIILTSLKLKKGRMVDWQYVRKQIEINVGNFLKKETGRSPLVVPVIVEV